MDTVKQELVFFDSDIQRLRSAVMDKWLPLPNTKIEIEEIASKFKEIGNRKGQQVTGIVATEKNIKTQLTKKTSPRVVHFATHGFFLEEVKGQEGEKKNIFTSSNDPMIRSGLILAGANPAWQGNVVQEGAEDGILTAYEIQNLNLRNTELVVLSACETGLGEIRGNEGVFGLQRAFKIAGAKHIIMSLWQVPDKQTAEFMIAFYEYWLNDKNSIKEAFSLAQKDKRKESTDPYLWAGFILIE